MSKIFGRLTSVIFRFLFASLISINYVYFVYYVWLPISSHNSFGWLVVFFFNFLFIMTIWSIVVTITGDPGSVPLYWGFHIGDSESKRKRYCLVCNVFKPERTHHCSVCNRCVLNMDHHCPWINRCIGFYNRKYFLQMLLYLNLTIIFIVLVNFKMTSGLIIQVIENKIHISGLYSSLIYIFIYIADVLILFVLVNFFKYHIQIALENKTTLENLDHNSQPFVSQYNLGPMENWLQVMGKSKLLWFLPLRLLIGNPNGNGLDWDISKGKETKLITNSEAHSRQTSDLIKTIDVDTNERKSEKILNPSNSLSSLYTNYKFQSNSDAGSKVLNKVFKNSLPQNKSTNDKIEDSEDNKSSSRIELALTNKGHFH